MRAPPTASPQFGARPHRGRDGFCAWSLGRGGLQLSCSSRPPPPTGLCHGSCCLAMGDAAAAGGISKQVHARAAEGVLHAQAKQPPPRAPPHSAVHQSPITARAEHGSHSWFDASATSHCTVLTRKTLSNSYPSSPAHYLLVHPPVPGSPSLAALRPHAAAAVSFADLRPAVRRGACRVSAEAFRYYPLQGNMLNWRSRFATKKLLSTLAGAMPDDSEFQSVDAPLEPETWEGSFLCGLLKNLPHIFLPAAAKQLQELSNQREDTLNRWEHSIGSKEDCLHRRIAELKEQECQTAIEDIMYMLIVYKYFKIEVPMVPNLSKLISNRRLQLWPPRETDLESIHGPEVLELIREHLTSIIRWVHRNGPKINRSTLRIKRLQFGRIYSASIMYGYFLKSVSIRHHLELTLTRSEELPPIQFLNAQFTNKQEQEEAVGGSGDVSSSSKPSSVVNPHDLKGYMMGFDPKTLQLCAKLRSCEAANLIERHSWALFGENMEVTQENDEAVILDPSSLKRLLLEAIAFGSFLWEVEDYVDEIYKLSDN